MNGFRGQAPISVAVYATAWRIEIVNDESYRGLEYVR